MESLEEQTKKVEEYWDNFSETYSSFMDKNASVFLTTLINMVKIDQGQDILEIGCGASPLLPLILSRKSSTASYYATDLSNKLL